MNTQLLATPEYLNAVMADKQEYAAAYRKALAMKRRLRAEKKIRKHTARLRPATA